MEQSCQNKIAIVGGGPAGIYCALNILKKFKDKDFNNFCIHVFDKSKILNTILPTGGTRCNITNGIEDIKEFASNYPRGEKFLYSVFSKHFSFDTLDFFNSLGIKTYKDENNRFYPISNSSKEVRDKMLSELAKYKNIKIINKEILSKNDIKNYNYVIISAGSRNTEKLIKSFNHTLHPFKKALVALRIDNMFYPEGVTVKSLDGDFIFTKNGISGPLTFKISSDNVNKQFPYEIKVKLFNINELFNLIKENPKKSIGTIVSMLLPKSFTKTLIKDFDKKASEISKKDLEELSTLKLTVIGTENKGEIVNSGGVDLSELTNNCKSKIKNNLWFCGEILDIDGYCGGFNLQNCWSTGYVVANDVVKTILNNP